MALLRRVGLVDRDARRTRGEDAEAGVGPLGARVAEDRDLVARLDAEVDQAARHAAYARGQVGEADVDPLVADLVLQGGAIAELVAGEQRHVRHGPRTGARLGGGDRPYFHELLLSALGKRRSWPAGQQLRVYARCGKEAELIARGGYALARLRCWDSFKEARNSVLSIRPWNIGTPSSMHLEITSLRCIPASRASSVGVRWIAMNVPPVVDVPTRTLSIGTDGATIFSAIGRTNGRCLPGNLRPDARAHGAERRAVPRVAHGHEPVLDGRVLLRPAPGPR